MTRARVRGVLIVLVLTAAAVVPATAATANASLPKPPATFTATGFFHIAFVGHRWWLVDPSGHPFYSSGIDHVTASPDTDETTQVCPYCQAVAAHYPSWDAWADTQITRLRTWGFNTLGSFSDTDPRLTSQMPYTVLLSMASGDDWFDPSFAAHADQVASTLAARRDDPNLVGYFTDSELHWGPDWRSQVPVLDDYLALPAGSPGRLVAEQHVGDPSGFLYALAVRYFSVTSAAIHRYDPNHLILGVKAVAQLIEPQLLAAARPYVDVWSVDDYAILGSVSTFIAQQWPAYLPDQPGMGAIERLVGRPIMVGEYGFRAADSGLPNTWPPLFPVYPTQHSRAAAYAHYARQLYRTPWVVGDDWFELVDEPTGGRVADGENSNWGILTTADVPYTTMVDKMAKLHAGSPGHAPRPGPICLSWAPAASGPATCTASAG